MLVMLNSRLMVGDGEYKVVEINKNQFKQVLHKYISNYKSYIGYPNAAKIVYEITGTKVELNRDATILKDGDILLMITLKYRIQNPEEKSTKHGDHVDDYQFHLGFFKKTDNRKEKAKIRDWLSRDAKIVYGNWNYW